MSPTGSLKPGDLARIGVGGGKGSTVLVLRPDQVNHERGEPWWYVLVDGREILIHEKFLERVSSAPEQQLL